MFRLFYSGKILRNQHYKGFLIVSRRGISLAAIPNGQITGLAANWSDDAAKEELFIAAYSELRRQARLLMRRERENHTLEPTAVVHEAWMQLCAASGVKFESSRDFFAYAGTVMRHILVGYARRRKSRGGDAAWITLDESMAVTLGKDVDILALNEALEDFERIDPVRAKVVEQKYFAGLTTEQIAEFTGIPRRTVNRYLFAAKAWLSERLATR